VPFNGVAADTVYGVGDIEQQLRQAGKRLCARVSSAHVFRSWGKRDQSPAPPRTSHRRGVHPTGNACPQGTEPKDRGCIDWCYLELADLDASQFQQRKCGLWTRGLADPRRIADGDLASSPPGAQQEQIETLVAVEGHRLGDRDSFETAKNEFGLDHNESVLARLASPRIYGDARLRHDGVIRHHANPPQPKKKATRTTQKTKPSGLVIDPMVNPGSSPHRH